MNLRFNNKRTLIAIVCVVLIVALIAGEYFLFLKPLKNEVKTVKTQLETEEKLYEAMAQRVADSTNEVLEQTSTLQKKLPVQPFLEQFLLDLEKAEVISNSLITNMSFSDGELSIDEATQQNLTVEEQINADTDVNYEVNGKEVFSGNEAQQGENQTENQPAIPTVPEGMKRITVNLTVKSDNYFDMLKFLKVIENLERITKIDSLSLAGGEEVKSVDDKVEGLTYTLVLSTFYYPKLEELKDQLPAFETPPPSNKDNPLPTGMYLKEDPKEKDSEVEIPPPPKESSSSKVIVNEKQAMVGSEKTTKTIESTETKNAKNDKDKEETKRLVDVINTYTVQKGDTLFSISMKLLNSNRVDEIMKLNNLQNTNISVGQKIKIPME
ncbi:LysM peptidoglycan-binding domain-containing protein [Schinkia azotoformans]|uniref:LysM peptidoglycan-binding domain-containing protein n=1 Tax=Schinkia azotoformans TaxID=1454 RepID=UPI002DB656DD|nr:LysM peptidoglycan-binding domain-containing protein [Schinkia azotoformans]MEC1696830.1 LysM peptidoglycan-binding domain-containing protein [Schinkia azotoformans]